MSAGLEEARRLCAEITERHGPNFSVGFRTLPDPKRRAIQASYAFCRIVDDLADEDLPAPDRTDDVRPALRAWRLELDAVYAGCPRHPVGWALADALERFDLPRGAFEDLIEGCERDLDFRPPRSEVDLEDYCDLVATSIGRICLAVFGYRDRRAPRWARQLSHALQMTNILRDVREDLGRGRTYLPLHWLEEEGLRPADLVGGDVPPWRRLMQRGVDFAAHRFEASRPLLDDVQEDSRRAVALMRGIYREILHRIAVDPAAVLRGRVALSEGEKQALVRAHEASGA